MAEQRVVVEAHLRVQRDNLAGAGHHQRVDLDDRAIQRQERAIHRLHETAERRDLLAGEPERVGQPPAVERRQAGRRIDAEARDFFRMVRRDLLDLHPAFAGGHDGDARRRAIDQQRHIEFAGDVAAGLDIDAMHAPPGGPVCLVTSTWPSIASAAARTSAAERASRTPPRPCGSSAKRPAPRPPAWICAFTT